MCVVDAATRAATALLRVCNGAMSHQPLLGFGSDPAELCCLCAGKLQVCVSFPLRICIQHPVHCIVLAL